MARWFTVEFDEEIERAHAALPELPIENVELSGMLLDVAREQVLAYAPNGEPAERVANLLYEFGVEEEVIDAVILLLGFETSGQRIPTRYAYAQLQQAKNLWLAGRGADGPEGFTFAARPLTRDIQRIIRPTSGAASVF